MRESIMYKGYFANEEILLTNEIFTLPVSQATSGLLTIRVLLTR